MSSSPRIFVTGASGYVGGNIIGRLLEKHPEWHVAALVRNTEQKKIVLDRWPQVEAVIGDLDNSLLMIMEGSKADVVLREYLFNRGLNTIRSLSRQKLPLQIIFPE
jgi:nucleoside-diphosphate-sugar epimerase